MKHQLNVGRGPELIGRRELIVLLSGAVLRWPLESFSQPALAQTSGSKARVGFPSPQPRSDRAVIAFFDELRRLGYDEGTVSYASAYLDRRGPFAVVADRRMTSLVSSVCSKSTVGMFPYLICSSKANG